MSAFRRTLRGHLVVREQTILSDDAMRVLGWVGRAIYFACLAYLACAVLEVPWLP